MATGKQNKLTGQIGEHLISAKLGTLGFYASPYSGNVPGFDITAVNSESLRAFPVQVKTSTTNTLVHSRIDKWVKTNIDTENRYHFGELIKLKNPDIIWVMIQIKNNDLTSVRYFLCKESDIQKRIVGRFTKFMEKHNFHRPHGGNSLQAILSVKHIEDFEDNWELLTN